MVARRQLLAAGLDRTDVETLLRRRALVPCHPGVYLTHTGPATYRQRCRAAVTALLLGAVLRRRG